MAPSAWFSSVGLARKLVPVAFTMGEASEPSPYFFTGEALLTIRYLNLTLANPPVWSRN